MVCQTVIFSIWITQPVKQSSHFPQSVEFSSVLSCSFLLSLKCRNLSRQYNLSCFTILPQKAVKYWYSVYLWPSIMSQLHNNFKNPSHFLNSHCRQCGPPSVRYVQVPLKIYVSLFQQQLCNNCLLYTDMCTKRCCKFILKLLWHVSVSIHHLQGVHSCVVSYSLLSTSATHTHTT